MSGTTRRNKLPAARQTVRARGLARLLAAAIMILAGAAALPADTFSYSGDSMSTVMASGNERALLRGHARVETETLRITADEIELLGKDFIYARCRGNVRVVDAGRGLDLTSRELFYDRKQKIARVKGNAVMADLKNEMVVKGGYIEDRDSEKITVVQIGVRIVKKDLVCRAESAKYMRDKKILELSGMPWVSRKSDEYRAARIVINLDTEEISLEGDVKGTIQSEGKDEKKQEQKQEGTPAPDSPPGAGQPPAGSPERQPKPPSGSGGT